jgi:hypothetical protein
VVKDLATVDCYDFPARSEVDNHKGLYKSFFAGFAMTFMSRDMWLRYPFDCIGDPGYQSDYRLSCRLQNDGVDIWGVPGAFMPHLRLDLSTKHLQGGTLLVGQGTGSVKWDI